jgi:hypothetical protein
MDRGKPKSTNKETYPTATLSNINLTQTGPRMSPGFHSDRLTTNFLNHDKASVILNV